MALNKKKKRAIIVGGSIGGLFAGNILSKNGWEVDILEKAKVNLASRGTGIARHTELENILTDLGLPPDESVGIAVRGRTAFNRKGQIIAEYPLHQRLGAWNKVFEPLYNIFPRNRYHKGHKFIGLEKNLQYTRVFTSTGKHFDADVIIGADGFSSAVRRYIDPEICPKYSGYVGWRGISEELKLSDNFRRNLFSHYAFLFLPQSLLIGYPIAGNDGSIEVGSRRYNYLWYYPTTEEKLKDLLTDNEGYFHSDGIPPSLIKGDHITDIMKIANKIMPKNFIDIVTKASTTMFQPIYDVMSEKIVSENIVLIGDAAFVARPHVGIGVLKAAQDAVSLANALIDNSVTSDALTTYALERFEPGRQAVIHGRNLGSFIERRLDKPEDELNLNLPPERIIRVSGRPYEHVVEQGL